MRRVNKPTKDPHCKKCGALKEGAYAIESMCGSCLSEYRKQKRLEKRLAAGAKPRAAYGSGRSPLCSKCGQQKDDANRNSGYCSKCKIEIHSLERKKAREESGLKPYGSGRKLTCCRCEKVKENPDDGYCYECANYMERKRYAERRKDFDCILEDRKRTNERCKFDPVFRLKKNVRMLTFKAIKCGLLVRKPCEVCSEEKVDAHHDDYTKPLDVRWLCRKHHNEHHRREWENELQKNGDQI